MLPYFDGCCRAAAAVPSPPPPSLWQGGEKEVEQRRFTAWFTGTTNSAPVDAAIHRLWSTGFIPQSNRLLIASCLVEGLGINWRRGDLFRYTLVDHDPMINESMW